MKNPLFSTRAVTQSDFEPGNSYSGGSIGVIAPGKIAMEVLGDEISFGRLFAYCFRRFGLPNTGSDPYKEIAEYLLTTPMSGVFLDVLLKANTSTSLLFGYVMTSELSDQLQAERKSLIVEFHANFLKWRTAKELLLPRDAGGEYDRDLLPS